MSWVDVELKFSLEKRKISPNLILWLIKILKKSLCQTYGSNYSDRCLQASLCMQHLLNRLHIKSSIECGALCVGMTYPDLPSRHEWEGFWDKNHHVWLRTEYKELIDVTISQLNIHPKSNRYDALEVPVVWWQQDKRPQWIRHLPDYSSYIELQLNSSDETEFKRLIHSADQIFDSEIDMKEIPQNQVVPILMDTSTILFLIEVANPWVLACLKEFESNSKPLPPWIIKREGELYRTI